MQAYQLINNMIPPLKPSDRVKMGLTWMEEIRTNVLPVVEGGRFKGMITDEMIYNLNQPDMSIGDVEMYTIGCYVYGEKQIYDYVKVSSELHLTKDTVLDRNYVYRGVVTIEDAIAAVADTLWIQTIGDALILSIPMTEYSLYEIARV